MYTWVRCHCCGEWLFIRDWDNKEPTYCERCCLERTGTGRGKCRVCQEFPGNLLHWNDPKPTKVPGYLIICMR